MIYAKHKTTQAEFVKAWWEKVNKQVLERLERYAFVSGGNFSDGITYKTKLWAIPNNALRRAGLKPRRRNGERKKGERTLDTQTMQKVLREIDRHVQREMNEILAKTANAIDQLAESHYQENEAAGFQHWLETTQKQPYFGRVMIHKNEPFVRWE